MRTAPTHEEARLVAYLEREAGRARVDDTLDDIEDGVQHLSITSDRPPRRALAPAVVAMAAAFVLIVALVGTRGGPPTDETVPMAALPPVAEPGPDAEAPGSDLVDVVAAPELEPAADTVPLPAGAVLQGMSPVCTTVDSIEYDCVLAAYPGMDGFDMTGTVYAIVDDTSRVSGGCRSTSPDGTSWTCYVGTRAVDEQIVGENFLGEWAPRERAEG